MKYIVDTNFLIRYLLADGHDQFIKTKEVFDKAISGEVSIKLEQTVFTEVIFVLSSFYKVPRIKISETLSALITYKGIDSDKETLLLSLDYYSNYNIHIVDCLLLAKAKINNDLTILSFDQKLQSIIKTDIV